MNVVEERSRSLVATELTLARLRAVEGPRLYRDNAFRVVGLPTQADRRTVRQRQRLVLPAVEAGADVDLGHSLPVGLDELRTAFDRLLNSPHARLVDEIFWLWGNARDDCGCPPSVHQDHDRAVRAHSAVLDLEAKDSALTDGELDRAEKLWAEAGRQWWLVLRQDAFWQHVCTRIVTLDEPQLGVSVVDALRARVPLSLLRPLIDLAVTSSEEQSWLADRARSWPTVPRQVVDDLLEEAVAGWFDAVRETIRTVVPKIESRQLDAAARIVYDEVMPQLRRLEAVVPQAACRRTASVYNEAAVALSNCATQIVESFGFGGIGNAVKWYGTARELATDPSTVEAVDRNTAMIKQLASLRTAPHRTTYAPRRRQSVQHLRSWVALVFWLLFIFGSGALLVIAMVSR